MPTRTVDVAILGAGTAGLNARRAAESAGADAVMIDPGPYGTTCARVGCMPSKLLIAPAEAVHKAQMGEVFGFEATVKVDGRRVMERVRRERDRFVGFVQGSIDGHLAAGRLIPGRAHFLDPNTLQAGDTRVHARAFVLATGSSPWTPPPFRGLSAARMLDNESLFNLDTLPASVLVVGPGVIGLELGQALHRLGVRVTIVGVGGLIGPFQDPKMRAAAAEIFKAELDLHIDYQLQSVTEGDDGVHISFTGDDGEPRNEVYERVLVAAGRRPNTVGIGLGRLDLGLEEGKPIAFDSHTMQVGDSHLFIAGDANNERPLLHEAADEGRIAGGNAATWPKVGAFPRRTALGVVFTDPQMGVVGDSWRIFNCKAHRVGQVRYEDQGRARVMAENKGIVRLYGHAERGSLDGAELLGPAVEHTSHLLAWSVQQRLTVNQILDMPFYHPTVEEGIRTALQDLRDKLRISAPTGGRCDEFEPGA